MSASRAAIATANKISERLMLPSQLPKVYIFVRKQIALKAATGFLLMLGAFLLYWQTLVPGVLDGDQGEFQFLPSIPGIPHATGFPLYVILGYLWSLLPIGALAFRMNLFSAFWAALVVGAVYYTLRRQAVRQLAAIFGAIAVATLPQFWQFATVAAVYRLHTFLVILVIAFLLEWERTRDEKWLWLGLLTFGFDLSNHLTIAFIAPATALFLVLVNGKDFLGRYKYYLPRFLLCALPLLLVLYFPLRAAMLLSSGNMLSDWARAYANGSVSPLYQPSARGFFEFITGAVFFGTVTNRLPWTFASLATEWLKLVQETVGLPIIILFVLGSIALARRRGKVAIWLLLIVALQIVEVQYLSADLASIGQLSPYSREYPLPTFVVLIMIAAWGLDALAQWIEQVAARIRLPRVIAIGVTSMIIIALAILVAQDGVARRLTFYNERHAAVQATWDAIKTYPPEPGAALMSHWGDLTPLWYFQTAEGWRRDLLAIHPPDDKKANEWLASGKSLYLAGPLLGWAPNIAQGRTLTPWGPLVRVAAQEPRDALSLSRPANWDFEADGVTIRLQSYDVTHQQDRVGDTLRIAASWGILDTIDPANYVAYVSLVGADGSKLSKGYPLVVSWFPSKQLNAGQHALAVYEHTIPWGARPGAYTLALDVYAIRTGRTLTVHANDAAGSSARLDKVQVQRAARYPNAIESEHPTAANFGRVALLGWNGNLPEAQPGDTLTLDFFWQAQSAPQKIAASIALENRGSARRVSEQILGLDYADWQRGEILRAPQSFALPADLADGEYTVQLSLRDVGTQASLPRVEGWFARSEALNLGTLRVAGRQHSFTVPTLARQQSGNFDNRIALLGYTLDVKNLKAREPIRLTLAWQAKAQMSESHKLFVHFVDAQGKIWAQEDRIPGNRAVPTTAWVTNEVITDVIELAPPENLPAGRYQTRIGFYNPTNGQRLKLAGAAADFIALDTALDIPAK